MTTCPHTPPLFADLTTGRCVASCIHNLTYLFQSNTARECRAACPANYFADPSIAQCVLLCNNNPSLFADTTSGSGVCVHQCPKVGSTYYYADGRTRACQTTCPTQAWNTFADPTTHQCVLVCPTDYYRDKTVPAAGVCTKSCTAPLLADPTTGDCVADCPNPLLADSVAKTCVKACPDGQYANLTQKKCLAVCDSGLGYWADNYTFVCVTSCPSTPSLYALDSSSLCVEMCPGPTLFGNAGTRKCVAASACQPGYFADPLTRLCVQKCPAAYYLFG